MASTTRTEAQRAASRRNGSLSAGPVTPYGKVKVSTNGLIHGLRSERVVLPHEDPTRHVQHAQAWVDSLKPGDDAELEVVVSIADVRWRLQRLDQVEQNRIRAEALAQADELPEVQHLRRVEDAAQAAATMAEIVPKPNLRTDEDVTALVAAIREVTGMIRKVEAERPRLFLGADQLAEAAGLAAVLSVDEVSLEARRLRASNKTAARNWT